MPFDLRPAASTDSAEGQLAEGGADQWENCTLACLALTMRDLGYGDPMEPQDMRSYLGVSGGLPWSASVNVVHGNPQNYPNPPLMRICDVAVTPTLINDYGTAGCMVHWAGWCTPGGDWITQEPQNGISHAGRVLAWDGSTWTLWNPISGVQTLSNSDFAASYDHSGVLVFVRSLNPMVMQDVLDSCTAALDAGTADGELGWAATNKKLAATVDELVNQMNALSAQVAALSGTIVPSTPVDLSVLAAQVEHLAAHLGEGTA
jgi:hypothetical protein